MKKLALTLCLLFSMCFSFAAELNSAQERLRNDIMNYIRREGFVPEIDNDGDIRFKKEGTTYFVRVDAKETNPMYVVFFCLYNKPSNYSVDAVRLATAELNQYKGVKTVVYDTGTISVESNMFMNDAEPFRAGFYRILQLFGYVEEDILDECRAAAPRVRD